MTLVDMTTTTQNDDESRNQICLASVGLHNGAKLFTKSHSNILIQIILHEIFPAIVVS